MQLADRASARPRANRHRFPAGNSAVAGKDPLLAWAVRWKWTSTCAGASWRWEASSPFSSSSCSSSRAAVTTTSPQPLDDHRRRHRRGRRRPADHRGLHRRGRRDLRPREPAVGALDPDDPGRVRRTSSRSPARSSRRSSSFSCRGLAAASSAVPRPTWTTVVAALRAKARGRPRTTRPPTTRLSSTIDTAEVDARALGRARSASPNAASSSTPARQPTAVAAGGGGRRREPPTPAAHRADGHHR